VELEHLEIETRLIESLNIGFPGEKKIKNVRFNATDFSGRMLSCGGEYTLDIRTMSDFLICDPLSMCQRAGAAGTCVHERRVPLLHSSPVHPLQRIQGVLTP
jgi:hypothetical protein